MTEPQQPPAYPWLSTEAVLGWLSLDTGSPHAGAVEACRAAAAAYCQQQRPDLLDRLELVDELGQVVSVTETFDAGPSVVMAGMIATARLFARRSTPAGLASFGEFGAAEVLRLDPDVARLLGTGRHAAPRVG